MELEEIINTRRAYRSLKPIEITEEIIKDLATHASLSASCFNNQPWRYVFVYEPEQLKKMQSTLNKGNEWGYYSSMIIAVLSKREFDCLPKDGREYYLFDVGMGTAFMLLRATEMGLVAHPIAGYDPQKVREVLNIPNDLTVVTLVIVGKHTEELTPVLSKSQIESEKKRPERLALDKIMFLNKYQ